MTTHTVHTQAELDAAIKKHGDDPSAVIAIDSPAGAWLTVEACDSATVEACDSATVRAYDSATVRAYGSATVEAYGSATVRAYGSATVRAFDSATVRASAYVAVHLFSAAATVSGGVIIDVTTVANSTDPTVWAGYNGADHSGGEDDPTVVTLYKAVDDNYMAGRDYRPTKYAVGEDVTAPDWRDDNNCGGGLHASPHPHQAMSYAPTATRMLRVTAPIADIRPIIGGAAKAKARTFHVVEEVQLDGSPLPAGEKADR